VPTIEVVHTALPSPRSFEASYQYASNPTAENSRNMAYSSHLNG
jgi:hypothetical protein